jgi:hypothetical protein
MVPSQMDRRWRISFEYWYFVRKGNYSRKKYLIKDKEAIIMGLVWVVSKAEVGEGLSLN